ncbi:MAG: YbhB/YbcL family Raf kinase inhibitor-like protein [Burkholderiales bacterium]|nr:YbhB/YbcL family Raf kinase inhibitor-like protein [Burkholderiales bacterium]
MNKKTAYRRISLAIFSIAGAAAILNGCAADLAMQDRKESTVFTLSSPGRTDNDMLAKPFAGKNPSNANCVGDNISPALSWGRVPAGTRSLAIVMDDQAGRAGLGVSHWIVYGIDPSISGLAEGEASGSSGRFLTGKNTIGVQGYLGPCPPKGNAPQHYVFTLIATTLPANTLQAGLTKVELLDALKGKTLAAASFVLRFAH